MLGDWLAVFESLKDCYIDDAYSNIAVNEAIERHKECSSGFVRAFTKGVLRDSMRLDYCIDKLAAKGVSGVKKRTLIVLRMGIYAIDSLDSVPEYAAVSEAVALSKKVSKGSDRFVNAVLRGYIREKENISSVDDNLSIKYSFPEEVVALLKSQYGDETEKLLAALNNPPDLVIRPNTLKISKDALIEQLLKESVECGRTQQDENALVVIKGQPVGSKLFKEGYFSVQTLSSIRAIEAFSPKRGCRVLDMCAAPGGKSCAMAEIMGDEGEIVACDIYPHRLELIKAQAARLEIGIISTELLDGTELREEYINSFDYVLADVPCSGLGVVGSKPELKLRTEPSEYKELIKTQNEILDNAYQYVRKGGRIMYSTCTVNKDENDGVIEAFLERHRFATVVEKSLILPYNNNLVGFYYCIIEKQ